MKKTNVFGLSENIASLLAYVLGFVSGIIVLVLEKENKTVRFHALQSTIWFALIAVLFMVINVIGVIPLLGGVLAGLLSTVLGILAFASWVFLIVMALLGNKFKIPVIGDVVSAQVNK